MNTSTLTIRMNQAQRKALKQTAARLKKSESQLVRELLAREFGQASFGDRADEFIGMVASAPARDPKPDTFREAIKRNNWRPL